MNPLVQAFKKYGYLSEELQSAIDARTKYFFKKKNDFFLKEGQVVSSIFIMKKGLIRAYLIKNGMEVTTWFGEEDQFLGSIPAMYQNKPSLENLQFLEESEVYAISYEELQALYHLYPEFNTIGRRIAEELCVLLEERINSLHKEQAIDRYNSLMKTQPHLLNRVSLGFIASYLGITQETLSRIRR